MDHKPRRDFLRLRVAMMRQELQKRQILLQMLEHARTQKQRHDFIRRVESDPDCQRYLNLIKEHFGDNKSEPSGKKLFTVSLLTDDRSCRMMSWEVSAKTAEEALEQVRKNHPDSQLDVQLA